MRQNLSISLKKELLEYIDVNRGEIPRSRVIESLIQKGVVVGTDKCWSQMNQTKPKEEGDAGAKQLPTNEAPCIPSNTDKQVDV